MTENEAIKVFKELLDVPCEMLVKYDSVATEEQKKALVRIRVAEDMAIKALEENQKFHAIGTIEEFKALKETTVTQSDIDTFKAYIDDCMDDVAFGNTDWNHSFSLALKCMELHKS